MFLIDVFKTMTVKKNRQMFELLSDLEDIKGRLVYKFQLSDSP